MGIISLILGSLGGIAGIMGVIYMFELLDPFIEGEGSIGPIMATTGFLWGIAVILLLGAIAVGRGGGSSEYD